MLERASIQPILSRRPGLPPAVHPEPLIRISLYVIFDHFREQCRVRDDISVAIFGANQLYSGIEAQSILFQSRVPDGEAGDDGRISLERYPRDSTGGTRLNAEKIHEHALTCDHVGIHEHTDGFAFAHGRDQTTRKIFVHGFVAVHGSIASCQAVEVRIVKWAHDDPERMPIK